MFNCQTLIARIEELEDLVHELKTQNSPQEVLDLRSVINEQAGQISALKEKLTDTVKRRVKALDLFDKNDLYSTFQKVLRDKDEVIKNLAGQMREANQSKTMQAVLPKPRH